MNNEKNEIENVNVKEQNAVELTLQDVERVKHNIFAFQKLKSDIMKVGIDKCVIQNKEVLTRAGYDVTALAFNISTSTEVIERINNKDKYEIHVKVRATLPNGRFCDGIGVCDSSEFATGRIAATVHNIESKAATRARNRAIADLVGGGILSKEELEVGYDNNIPQTNQPITSKQLDYLNKLIANKSNKDFTNSFLENHGSNDIASLSKEEATKLIDNLKAKASTK